MVLNISCRRTDNLQPGTTIIKNLQYNGILNMTSFMQGSLSQISKFNQCKGSLPPAIRLILYKLIYMYIYIYIYVYIYYIYIHTYSEFAGRTLPPFYDSFTSFPIFGKIVESWKTVFWELQQVVFLFWLVGAKSQDFL